MVALGSYLYFDRSDRAARFFRLEILTTSMISNVIRPIPEVKDTNSSKVLVGL